MGLIILALLAILFVADVVCFSCEKYEWSIGIMVASIIGAYLFQPEFHTFIHADWLRVLTHYVPAYLGLGLVTAVVKWSLYTLKFVGKVRELKAKFDARNPEGTEILSTDEQGERTLAQHKYEQEVERFQRRVQQNTNNAAIAVGTPPVAPVYEPLTEAQNTANRREAFIRAVSNNVYGAHIHDVDFNSATAVVDAITPRARDNIAFITLWIFQWPIVVVDMIVTDFLVKLGKHAARLFDIVFSFVSRKLVAAATKGL